MASVPRPDPERVGRYHVLRRTSGALATFAVLVSGVVVATVLAIRAERNADAARRTAYAASLRAAARALEQHERTAAEAALRDAPAVGCGLGRRDEVCAPSQKEIQGLANENRVVLHDTAPGGREIARTQCTGDLQFGFGRPAGGGLRLVVPWQKDPSRHASGGFHVLDARTGETLRECMADEQQLTGAFPPHGTRIVTGGYGKRVRIWDAETLDELVQLRGHTDYVFRLVFSPDGRRLPSASGDTTLRVWDTEPIGVVLRARRGW
ncbi:MAG: hypothetical protein AAF628_23980 [Planctomycetota bacterium]